MLGIALGAEDAKKSVTWPLAFGDCSEWISGNYVF